MYKQVIQKIKGQTDYGNKDLLWFIKSLSGFMKDMTLFQESSKSYLKSFRMLIRKMNGFN